MPLPKKERRICKRFTVFGATVTYRGETGLWSKRLESTDRHPVLNISLGGLMFASQGAIKSGSKLTLTLYDANGAEILAVKGFVARSAPTPTASYAFVVAVQFHPYGPEAKQNSTACLAKLKELERQHLPADLGTEAPQQPTPVR